MPIKVLVIDDSPAARLILRAAIERVGVAPKDMLDTDDPLEALMVFQTIHPEVVFLDLCFRQKLSARPRPGRDAPSPTSARPEGEIEGGEVLAKFMLNEDPSLKLVLCTGAASDNSSYREVVKFGAFAVVEKPVTLEKIQSVFQRLAAEGLVISGSGRYHHPGEEHPLDLLIRGV
jgi:CheY-like chemotaxis protein